MDTKKKNFLENLRVKAKLPNLKKAGKRTPKKQGKKLAYRRSISVPDLRFVPGEGSPAESPPLSTATDGIYFGISPGISDTDSIASSSTNDVALFTEKLTVPGQESTRLLTDSAALNRVSAPARTFMLYEEMEQNNSASDGKMNLPAEAFYAQVDKRVKKKGQKFLFEPIPVPRRNALIPSVEPEESEGLSGDGSIEDFPTERVVSGPLAAALARAGSQGDQANPCTDQRSASFEQGRPLSAKGTPPAARQNTEKLSLKLDALGSPVESADGTSLDSACGSPNEDLVTMPWTTDWEGLDQESFSPLIIKDVYPDESLAEDISEMSTEPCDLYFDESFQDSFENSQPGAAGTEVQVPVQLQRYLLCITLKQGRNLVVRDKRTGTSDPYVKFKLDGKQIHRSKVVYKSLHPRWNESFTHPLRDRDHVVEVRVYDKNRTTDDFMGSSSIPLKDIDLFKTYEIELHLQDPKSKEDDMGVICIDVCLMFRDATIKKPPKWPQKKNKQKAVQSPRPAETQKNQQKNQLWSRVLAVTLVEGQDLPQYGHGDIYVRFRLGDQKYKSKNLCIQANPQWREQFDFNHFEDNQEPLQVEVYSKRGRKGEESWGMFEIDLSKLQVNERKLYTHPLGPGKGRLVFLVTLKPCCGVSISDMEVATLEKSDDRNAVMEKFSLKNSYKCVGDVGFLQVKVVKANELPATDLNGKSNPLCVIELGNSKLQTHTIYRTVNPEWNKAFTFPVKDIHEVVELTVLDENGDKAPTFLGKVAIPLLSIQNKQQVCLFLKKENLSCVSKGTITLEMEVIYNKVRAGIKTFQPKDANLTEENLKFSKKVLARNIYRVRKISTAVLYTLQYIKSCFQWESTQRSLIAFLIFLVTVWHWELFMLPLFLLLLIGWNYFHLTTGKASANQDLVNMSIGDDEEEDEKEASKKGLMDKIHMVQEVVLAVQAVLEELANIGERMKNLFNWSVPFLSCLACIVLFTATALLYLIPLRYIVLMWGVNKFTKKLRNPYAIDNNEILDFLQRVPSDVQKVQYSAARAPTSQNQQRKKK